MYSVNKRSLRLHMYFDYKFVSCLHNNHQVKTKTITQKHIHTIHMSGGHLGLA